MYNTVNELGEGLSKQFWRERERGGGVDMDRQADRERMR